MFICSEIDTSVELNFIMDCKGTNNVLLKYSTGIAIENNKYKCTLCLVGDS